MHFDPRMVRWIGLALTIAIGCRHPVDAPTFGWGDELGTRHVVRLGPGRPAAAALRPGADLAGVRFRMQQQFDDLRHVERLLLAGQLAEARSLAFLLSRPVPDPALEPWSAESARVSTAALALSRAVSIEDAYRLEARVAEACAGCHLRAGARLRGFDARAHPPPDAPTPAARKARHRWAADRVAEGLIATADTPWRAGLEVFAATQLTSQGDASGRRLQVLARDALAPMVRASLSERARTYGELLVTCAACHAALGRGDRRPPAPRAAQVLPGPAAGTWWRRDGGS